MCIWKVVTVPSCCDLEVRSRALRWKQYEWVKFPDYKFLQFVPNMSNRHPRTWSPTSWSDYKYPHAKLDIYHISSIWKIGTVKDFLNIRWPASYLACQTDRRQWWKSRPPSFSPQIWPRNGSHSSTVVSNASIWQPNNQLYQFCNNQV